MHDDPGYVPQLPEHPDLREIALVIEAAGMSADLLDASFRCVFLSSETASAMRLSNEEAQSMIGKSLITRTLGADYAGIVRVTEESGTAWWQHNAPIMRRHLEPGAPGFDEVFGPTAQLAAQVDPVDAVPRAWHDIVSFPPDLRFRRTMLGDQNQIQMRINDDAGSFIGVLYINRGNVPESLLQRLGRGDARLFERMERVSEPARRPAGILFADLEASGALSRRLSSRGYFGLIRDLTDRTPRSSPVTGRR